MSEKPSEKISTFLALCTPPIIGSVEKTLEQLGCRITKQGEGLETVIAIRSGDNEAQFYLRNLLLEIATVDRDAWPLEFDHKLYDFDYFLAKTVRVVESKLRILDCVFNGEDMDKALEKKADQYERITILRMD